MYLRLKILTQNLFAKNLSLLQVTSLESVKLMDTHKKLAVVKERPPATNKFHILTHSKRDPKVTHTSYK